MTTDQQSDALRQARNRHVNVAMSLFTITDPQIQAEIHLMISEAFEAGWKARNNGPIIGQLTLAAIEDGGRLTMWGEGTWADGTGIELVHCGGAIHTIRKPLHQSLAELEEEVEKR